MFRQGITTAADFGPRRPAHDLEGRASQAVVGRHAADDPPQVVQQNRHAGITVRQRADELQQAVSPSGMTASVRGSRHKTSAYVGVRLQPALSSG